MTNPTIYWIDLFAGAGGTDSEYYLAEANASYWLALITMLKQLQLTNPIIQMRYILPRILGILQ
jgi:hypothetical protein